MGYKFISLIETGYGMPSLDTFLKPAKALNVSLDSLIADEKHDEDKKISKNILQIQYLLSDLSNEQQEYFLKIIKEFKKIAK